MCKPKLVSNLIFELSTNLLGEEFKKRKRACSVDFPSFPDPPSSGSPPYGQRSLQGSQALLLCMEACRCVYVCVYIPFPLFFSVMIRHMQFGTCFYLTVFIAGISISIQSPHLFVVVAWNCLYLTSLITSLLMGTLPNDISPPLP